MTLSRTISCLAVIATAGLMAEEATAQVKIKLEPFGRA